MNKMEVLMKKIILLFALNLMVSGCGGYITKFGDSFEGLGDYGYAAPGNIDIEDKYQKGSGGPLVPGDYVSINLKSGYISYFPEGYLKRGANWLFGSPVRGEIAILVDVASNGLAGKETLKSGRVIYYSDDVYLKQMLSMSFTPVYGPVVYDGSPLGLSFRMMELDNSDNTQVKSVLDAIATVGSAASTAGSPLLINSMRDVGEALVKSNVDDKFGAFDAMFLGAGVDFGSSSPELKVGDYILIRKADRINGINWQDYCYNEKKGMLQIRDKSASDKCDTVNKQPDFTYMVFTVSRNAGTSDMTPTLKAERLISELNNAQTHGQMQAAAKETVSEYVRSVTMGKVRNALGVLAKKDASTAYRLVNAQVIVNAMQCSRLSRVNYTVPSSEFAAAKGVCGDDFMDGSLSNQDYEYSANRLAALNNCMKRDEIKQDVFFDQLNASDLDAKRAALVTRLSVCGS